MELLLWVNARLGPPCIPSHRCRRAVCSRLSFLALTCRSRTPIFSPSDLADQYYPLGRRFEVRRCPPEPLRLLPRALPAPTSRFTMADYAKKKNDELAALCKDRGLPHTGKKADLVKRLEDFDTQGGDAVQPVIEDEIDWDDEPAADTAKAATSIPAADAIAAGGVGVEVPNPQAVPNQIPAVDPAQTDDLSVDPPAPEPAGAEEEAKEPEKDYSQGLNERTIDEEIEKRKARARKFGLPEDSDEIKALERAKRFGTADLPGLLNKALPTGDRKRGRYGDEKDGGIRKRSRGPQRGGLGRRGGGGGRERTPVSGSGGGGGGAGGYPSWMTQQDREAADRRKTKFSTAG